MEITQMRNATIIIKYKDNQILVDPMLSAQGTLPKLRFVDSNKKNPLVDLPKEFFERKSEITHALITHCQKGHFDHLDSAGRKFLRDSNIETFSTLHDENYLRDKGINVRPLQKKDSFFDGTISQIRARHVLGFLTPFLEHGVGYFIELPNTPSLYLMGDTILTEEIRNFIKEEQPDYIVAPTGIAKFDIGSPLLLPEEDIKDLLEISHGKIIANHMDALDHCRMSRASLVTFLESLGHQDRVIIPRDGETIILCNQHLF